MPWSDWQFWLVSLLALASLGILIRPFVSKRASRQQGACPNCSDRSAGRPRRVALTIGQRPAAHGGRQSNANPDGHDGGRG